MAASRPHVYNRSSTLHAVCLEVSNASQPGSLRLALRVRRRERKVGERGRGREGEDAGEATRYKFPDIRPFVSFEMGQFSRDLMVIAFLGGHIAFHPVQCVRPIYQSSSLSRLGLSLG